MYPHLGHKKCLDQIRKLNPQPKDAKELIHCRYLRDDPYACNSRPAPGGKREICKMNPYHPDNVRKREELTKENPPLMDEAMERYLEACGRDVEMKIQMGLLSLNQISSTEFILARFFWNERRIMELQLQARMYGSTISRSIESDE